MSPVDNPAARQHDGLQRRGPGPVSQLAHADLRARLKRLPALPLVVTELLSSFAKEDIDVEAIASRIARDQGLAARVLRVANSSFYGLQNRVGSIHEAVVVLGFRAVRSMVLVVGMNGAFRVDDCPGFEVVAYLRHGLAVGLVARELAPACGCNPEVAFTAGLLHDIGELVLASCFPREYSGALALRQERDCLLLAAERDSLGITHAEVGELLAETWHFPPELRHAVAYHHAPHDDDRLVSLVHVADVSAHALGLSYFDGELVPPLDGAAWRRLGVGWEGLARVLPRVDADFEALFQVFRSDPRA